MNILRTRKERIKFLKDIQSGLVSIDDLRPARHFGLHQYQENPPMYEGGKQGMGDIHTSISEGMQGRIWSQEALDRWQIKHPKDQFLIFVPNWHEKMKKEGVTPSNTYNSKND